MGNPVGFVDSFGLAQEDTRILYTQQKLVDTKYYRSGPGGSLAEVNIENVAYFGPTNAFYLVNPDETINFDVKLIPKPVYEEIIYEITKSTFTNFFAGFTVYSLDGVHFSKNINDLLNDIYYQVTDSTNLISKGDTFNTISSLNKMDTAQGRRLLTDNAKIGLSFTGDLLTAATFLFPITSVPSLVSWGLTGLNWSLTAADSGPLWAYLPIGGTVNAFDSYMKTYYYRPIHCRK